MIRSFQRPARVLPTVLATLTLGVPVLFLLQVPGTVRAEEYPPTSKAAGVRLPAGGGAELNDAKLRTALGSVLKAWAAERELEPLTGKAEVFRWSGPSYKTGRTQATRTALDRTLADAGYKVKHFDRSLVRTSFYDAEHGFYQPDGTYLLDLLPLDRPFFFVASDAVKKRTVVGVWLDQEQQKRHVLALMAVKFTPDPDDAPLPPVEDDKALLVKDPNDAMRDVPAPKLPTIAEMKPVKGRVRGKAVSLDGKPLKGARIVIESSAAGGFKTSVTATTDEEGVYDMAVPQGVCRVVMTGYVVKYNGRHYALPLHPIDGECGYFPSNEGGVEHLVLLTHGIADPAGAKQNPGFGNNYYGGSVRLVWFNDDIPPGGTVEVTLTPKGKLLDGSDGRKLVVRLPNKFGGEFSLNNVPLGRYTVTARLLEKGDEFVLRVGKARERKWTDEVQVDFEPRSAEQVVTRSGGTEQFGVAFSL